MNQIAQQLAVCGALCVAGALVLCGCEAKENNPAKDEEAAISSHNHNEPQANKGEFKYVDLDQLIGQETAAFIDEFNRRKVIKMAVPVWFNAKMMRLPEAKKMSYIYTALQMAQVNPLPEVGHQMFVASPEGRVISVYVEKQIAQKILATLREKNDAQWIGYHVYTYAKGPAILVTDFVAASPKGESL